ncbi:amino acid ABC transporter permease [Amycolatopsis sp. MtRt-6]|uniref:amino acid ABC transporter permease n=1 Tax=Amycolatopsis sp. MtRt-6 TaxID=2792782 RepID=UPI001A8C5F34|nr:ABC transporter permease subunit [Amycolatopsis sp. MtRt-6]
MTGVPHDLALLLPGFVTTLGLTALTLAMGLPLAVVAAVCLRSGRRWVTVPVIVVIEVLRGMPALVTLYFVYYGLPAADVVLTDTLSICVAFGLTFVAYTAPILAAAIATVPHAHVEAGDALGLPRWTVHTKVVLPQAIRAAAPPLISWTVILFQGTSLASVVGASDLFARATSLGAQQFAYTYYILLAAVFYAALSIPFLALAARLHRRRPAL